MSEKDSKTHIISLANPWDRIKFSGVFKIKEDCEEVEIPVLFSYTPWYLIIPSFLWKVIFGKRDVGVKTTSNKSSISDEELAAKIKKAVLEAITRDCRASGVVKDKSFINGGLIPRSDKPIEITPIISRETILPKSVTG